MKFYWRKQWQDHVLIGFLRALRDYIFGQKCYMRECPGRMRITEQFEVGKCVHERVVCDKCDASLRSIY
jgi:hypothetical protein